MLEHNSDRMYWVIGAIVIGALIVIAAQKLFPDVFKQVGDTLSKMIGRASDKAGNVGSTIAPFLHL